MTEQQQQMKKQQRIDDFVAIAILLYGPRWQSPLAEGLGVSQALLSHVARGSRGLSVDLERKLADHGNEVGIKLAMRAIEINMSVGQLKLRLGDGVTVTQSVGIPEGRSVEPAPEPVPEPDNGPDFDP